jgi:hypothetical protein
MFKGFFLIAVGIAIIVLGTIGSDTGITLIGLSIMAAGTFMMDRAIKDK